MIVVLANIITMVTALSVSSLATSQRVGVGGANYLVSRSLGLEAIASSVHCEDVPGIRGNVFDLLSKL